MLLKCCLLTHSIIIAWHQVENEDSQVLSRILESQSALWQDPELIYTHSKFLRSTDRLRINLKLGKSGSSTTLWWWKCSISVLLKTLAVNHMGLLSTWNVASAWRRSPWVFSKVLDWHMCMRKLFRLGKRIVLTTRRSRDGACSYKSSASYNVLGA